MSPLTRERESKRTLPLLAALGGRRRMRSPLAYRDVASLFPIRTRPQFDTAVIGHRAGQPEAKTTQPEEEEEKKGGIEAIPLGGSEVPEKEKPAEQPADEGAKAPAAEPAPEKKKGPFSGIREWLDNLTKGKKVEPAPTPGSDAEAAPPARGREARPKRAKKEFRMPNPLQMLAWIGWFLNPINWFRGLGDGRSFGENLGRLFVAIIVGAIAAALWPLIASFFAVAIIGRNDESGIMTVAGLALVAWIWTLLWPLALPIYIAGAVVAFFVGALGILKEI